MKLYHPRDVAISIHNAEHTNNLLTDLNCKLERMQVEERLGDELIIFFAN